MSIPICGVNRMMPIRSMHGMGFMHGMQKPDASEIANQMINNRDKDSDGALNTDELGRLSDRMMPMRRMHGMGFMHCMQKPDASEIANQMINNRDKDGDGALNTDELGRLSDRMMPMRRMHGMGFMHCMQKPDASEIANQMINNRDKDGDGALNTDELGRLSDRMGLVEADFNEDGLIDQEKLISKISEKLEKMEGLPKIRGLKNLSHMYE